MSIVRPLKCSWTSNTSNYDLENEIIHNGKRLTHNDEDQFYRVNRISYSTDKQMNQNDINEQILYTYYVVNKEIENI